VTLQRQKCSTQILTCNHDRFIKEQTNPAGPHITIGKTVSGPVGILNYKGENITVGDGGVVKLTQKLYDTLTGIQYGKIADTFGWVRKIT